MHKILYLWFYLGKTLDLYEKLKNLSDKNFEKKTKIILMIVYAIIMFTAIQSKMNIVVFIILFAVVPIAIYFYIRKIFPKEK